MDVRVLSLELAAQLEREASRNRSSYECLLQAHKDLTSVAPVSMDPTTQVAHLLDAIVETIRSLELEVSTAL